MMILMFLYYKDMQELVNQFNLLAQMVSIMVPKGR